MPRGVSKSAKCNYPRIDEVCRNAEPAFVGATHASPFWSVAQMWIEGRGMPRPYAGVGKPVSAHRIDGR